MLFRFCHITRKTADSLFKNITRHYASANVSLGQTKTESIYEGETKIPKKKIPIIKCKKQLYDLYTDDLLTKSSLTLACHGWLNRNTRNDYFFIYPHNCSAKDANEEINLRTFKDLNVDVSVCNELESMNIWEPLEIQRLGIPRILEGRNVLLAAETGCGKTMAYLLPLVTKILTWKQHTERNVNSPLGLIVTPSRELAVQIALELIKLSKHLGIKTKIITGGKTKKMMLDPPVDNVDVIVSSFGVISKLTTVGIYDLRFIRFVVLDEADALFHITFEEKLQVFMKKILVGFRQDIPENECPSTAQIILTSATIPSRMRNVLSHVLNPDSIEHVTTKNLHKILVPQKFIRLIPSQKPAELLQHVKPKAMGKQRIIIFSNRNTTSHWISRFLYECGIEVTNLHGDMNLSERRGKYGEFLNGKTAVLSTTNGGSRGLDTVMVNHILNYDFPLNTADYIHRCGRTGRLGSKGSSSVTNFISTPGEVAVVKAIEMAARKMSPIPIFDITAAKREKEVNVEMEEELENNYIQDITDNLDEVDNIPY